MESIVKTKAKERRLQDRLVTGKDIVETDDYQFEQEKKAIRRQEKELRRHRRAQEWDVTDA